MLKRMDRAFQICIKYGGGEVLTPSYGAPKSTQISFLLLAMSISGSEILREKRKKREVEKLLGDHGRSMGGHVRSVGVMGGQ